MTIRTICYYVIQFSCDSCLLIFYSSFHMASKLTIHLFLIILKPLKIIYHTDSIEYTMKWCKYDWSKSCSLFFSIKQALKMPLTFTQIINKNKKVHIILLSKHISYHIISLYSIIYNYMIVSNVRWILLLFIESYVRWIFWRMMRPRMRCSVLIISPIHRILQ